MKAEIVTIGTELLLGQIVDSNAAFLARQLAEAGFDVFRKTTVGDNEARIAEAVRSALERADVVITSGGLGPTVDDKTREGVALATGRPLVFHSDLFQSIKDFFERRGLVLGENNARQAYIPESSIPIPNPVGTAPGFIVNRNGRYVVSLPGVPRELYHLTEEVALPFLRNTFGLRARIRSRILRTAGMGESNIDRLIADLEESVNPTVGLSAHPGSVDIRISAKSDDPAEALRMLDRMEERIRSRLGDRIYGVDKTRIEEVVVASLAAARHRLALLETNTGGVMAERISAIRGGMGILDRGIVAPYERAVRLFPEASASLTAAASEGDRCTRLAEAIRSATGASIGMALIGDSDPEVGPYSKRTGETCIGISKEGASAFDHIRLGGISSEARTRIVTRAFEFLRRFLISPSGCTEW